MQRLKEIKCIDFPIEKNLPEVSPTHTRAKRHSPIQRNWLHQKVKEEARKIHLPKIGSSGWWRVSGEALSTALRDRILGSKSRWIFASAGNEQVDVWTSLPSLLVSPTSYLTLVKTWRRGCLMRFPGYRRPRGERLRHGAGFRFPLV